MNKSLATVLISLIFSVGCGSSMGGDEDTSSTSQDIINGRIVVQDKIGTVGIVDWTAGTACSATMLNPMWVLTAHHCVTNESVTTGGTATNPFNVAVQLNLTAPFTTVQSIYLHPTLDVALVYLTQPLGNFYNTFYQGSAKDLIGKDVYCEGWGDNHFSYDENALRWAWERVSQLDGNDYILAPIVNDEIDWHGDSGSSCFLTTTGQIVGVASMGSANGTTVVGAWQVSAEYFRDWAMLVMNSDTVRDEEFSHKSLMP